jgi:hypothetical protein
MNLLFDLLFDLFGQVFRVQPILERVDCSTHLIACLLDLGT